MKLSSICRSSESAISVAAGKGVSTSLLLDTGLGLLGCSPLECLEGSGLGSSFLSCSCTEYSRANGPKSNTIDLMVLGKGKEDSLLLEGSARAL